MGTVKVFHADYESKIIFLMQFCHKLVKHLQIHP